MQMVLTSMQMQKADRYTSQVIGIPSLVLMERAALEVADRARELTGAGDRILILCGQGGNGGDGFAAGRLLLRDRPKTEVFFVGDERKMSRDCALQKQIYEKLGGVYASDPDLVHGYELVIDAVYGVGLSRPVCDDLGQIFAQINGSDSRVLSVDIPSGISADDGSIMGYAMHADQTVTFQFLKRGHLLYPGVQLCGGVTVADVGIVRPKMDHVTFTFDRQDIRDMLPGRLRRSHKGMYGHALITAGRKNMAGCAYLAGAAAMAMGTGLVMVQSPEENRQILQSLLPEALYRPLAVSEGIDQELSGWCTGAAIGPGLGTTFEQKELLRSMLKQIEAPVVLDADALTLLAGDSCLTEILHDREERTVLTPHPAEMSRLLGRSAQDILADPLEAAGTAAKHYHSIVVLKDAATIVTDGERSYINRTGCDGMASGGSGDVLTGMICALLAQGMPSFDAACAGVYLHGAAGEAAQERLGARSMQAGDIVRGIAAVLMDPA